MNVRKLKELLKDMPDDAIVVVEGRDHSYWRQRSATLLANAETDGEYIGESYGNLSPGCWAIPILLIS